jgi:hypothetical protein
VQLIRKLREDVARKRIRTLAAKRPTQHRPVSLDRAERIGVLYVCDSKYGACVPALLDQVPLQGKKLKVLKYRAVKPSKKAAPEPSTFSDRDISWWLKPSGEAVDAFLAEQFDILIDLSDRDYLPLLYIMASASADLNVSRYSELKKEVADLLIRLEGEEDAAALMKHIRHYLNQLNPS